MRRRRGRARLAPPPLVESAAGARPVRALGEAEAGPKGRGGEGTGGGGGGTPEQGRGENDALRGEGPARHDTARHAPARTTSWHAKPSSTVDCRAGAGDVGRTAMYTYRPYMHPCVLPMHWQG